MSAGGTISQKWSPKIGAQGCVVIDNSSAWRYDADVPLIVPEVNPDAVVDFKKRNIIANPNCSTAQLVVALKPLHDFARSSVSSSRPTSRCPVRQGRHGRTLHPDARRLRRRSGGSQEVHQAHRFSTSFRTSIASWKTAIRRKSGRFSPRQEDARSEDQGDLHRCARSGLHRHSESVNIEFENESRRSGPRHLRDAPGCLVIDKQENGGYITPVECAGEDATYISRIREDATVENGLNMWVVSDNLRKGAALNAIQIAELLLNRGLITPRNAPTDHIRLPPGDQPGGSSCLIGM